MYHNAVMCQAFTTRTFSFRSVIILYIFNTKSLNVIINVIITNQQNMIITLITIGLDFNTQKNTLKKKKNAKMTFKKALKRLRVNKNTNQ